MVRVENSEDGDGVLVQNYQDLNEAQKMIHFFNVVAYEIIGFFNTNLVFVDSISIEIEEKPEVSF